MRARSGHIIFDPKVQYSDLAPVFREFFTLFLEESGQMRDDPEFLEIIIEENLRDLRRSQKPEGFNREGTMRLIFPISDDVEFYIYGRAAGTEVPRVTEALSQLFRRKSLKHDVEWDTLLLFAERK
ncbi:MAG: hypothetical protein ACE5HJ_04565 [Thermoplasmata archaeon]